MLKPWELYAYDAQSNSVKLCVQVQGTQYEGRSSRIESIRKGNPLKLRWEPENPYSVNNIAVQNKADQSLGNLPADLGGMLSPLLDAGEAELHNIQASHVEPLSKRSACIHPTLVTQVSICTTGPLPRAPARRARAGRLLSPMGSA